MLFSESEAVTMWVQHNPNPKGKSVGDCTIRAISTALQKTWENIFMELAVQGLMMSDMPSANAVTTAYLRKKGFFRKTIPNTCPDCYTIEDFCHDHPKGVFVIGTGSHLTTVIDGTLFDSWDSRYETPVYYFERNDE